MVRENESPNEKFKRLATKRTNRVLRDLKILGNCANRSNYEYSQDEVRKIIRAIDDELGRVKGLFERGQKKDNEFKL